MSLGLRVRSTGFHELQRALLKLASPPIGDLLDVAGSVGVSQTKRRLTDEKRSPDGARWEPWSAGYAATRGGHHSLLIGRGNLRDSITYEEDAGSVFVGTNVAYARSHQFGRKGRDARGRFTTGRGLPARPFLGISRSDEDEMMEIGAEWLMSLLD